MGGTFDDLRITNSLSLTGAVGTRIQPGFWQTSEVVQTDNVVYPIQWTDWRVWDAYNTVLPGTSASDDLGLYGGAFGSAQPLIRTYDVKAAGAQTLRARAMVPLPDRYVAGQTVTIRLAAGMVTTVADTTCTLLVEAYRIGKDNSIGSQICPTGALTMNTLGMSTKSFTITASTLSAGDVLDVRMSIAVNDAATATAVIAAISGADLLCDIQG